MVIAGLAYNEIGSRRKCRDGDFCYGDRPQESMEKWGLAGACLQCSRTTEYTEDTESCMCGRGIDIR